LNVKLDKYSNYYILYYSSVVVRKADLSNDVRSALLDRVAGHGFE